MIGQLTGTIVRCSPDHVLLDVTGVGYEVHIPLSTFYTLAAVRGKTARLHVHTHVREDALQLFGFASRDERAAFEQLIGISGVGPKLALAILSGIGVDELRVAVIQRDRDRMQRIPGVGKKTAERLLLELRDKIAPEAPGGHDDGEDAAGGPGTSGERSDAVSALVNLGYSRKVADRAVEAALAAQPTPTLETVLKAALAGLVR